MQDFNLTKHLQKVLIPFIFIILNKLYLTKVSKYVRNITNFIKNILINYISNNLNRQQWDFRNETV